MGLRIISLFVVLFIGTNAHTIKDGDDHYEHMLELITDLQSTVISLEGVVCKQTTELEHMEEKVEKLESTETNLQSTVTNLAEVVTNQTTELEHMEEKVEKLEEKQLEMEENLMKCEGMVEEQNSTIEAVQVELQELAANISTIECSCNSSSEITTTKAPTTMEPTTTAPTTMEPTTTAPPTSCKPMKDTEDGVYTITVNNSPLQVYCQDGWTVIQKRYDGSLDYNRKFSQYADGFGSTAAEHWIGLNNMHELTSTGSWTLRFDLTAFNGETAWAEYDDFRIDPGTDFTLWFDQSSYRGTAGNALDYNHGRKFTTTDMDQDSYGGNCADLYGGGGGWWFGSCGYSLTTGMPYGGGRAIFWYFWKRSEVLKAATMKIIQN